MTPYTGDILTYTPGDILLVNDYSGSTDLLGNLIRAGERARYGDSDYARWTHSALIVTEGGDLVEAMANGVSRGHVSEYAHKETLVLHPPIDAGDPRRLFAVRFAEGHVGDEYGVLDFLSLAATLLTGLNWSLSSDKQFICSQLCARATESYTNDGYFWPSEQMMPGDLAFYYGDETHEPVPGISFFGRCLDKLKAVARAVSPF